MVGGDMRSSINNLILDDRLMRKLFEHIFKEASRKFDNLVNFCVPRHFEGYIQSLTDELDTYWKDNFAENYASIDLKKDHAPLLSAAVEKIKETNETVEEFIHGMHYNGLYLHPVIGLNSK
jgi:hypothetical protein